MGKKGQTIIELLVIIAICGIILPVLFSAFMTSSSGEAQQKRRFEAVELLRETTEAVRNVRERGWTNVSTNGTYHPVISGSNWSLASGNETVDGITREVVISNVERNASGAIVSSGGTVDPSTKQVVVTVSWTAPSVTSISSTLYLTRYLENASYTETTTSQFNLGASNPGTTGITIRDTSPPLVTNDGEIILGAGGYGNWCGPNLAASQINLSGGVATSVIASEFKAYVGTGENASGLPFINIGIDNNRPPTANQTGTSTLNYKSNTVFGDGNTGYFASDSNSKEVVFINLGAAAPYPEIGFFNAPGNGNGEGLYITSAYGYMTTGSNFYNFRKYGDTTSPIDADGVALTGTATKVYVVGNYAYVAVNSTTNQLNIIDLTSPTNLVRRGTLTLTAQGAKSIYVSTDGNRAYIVTGQSSTQNEFFIINTQTKSAPSLVSGGVWNTSPMDPRGIVVVPGNYAVLVGWNGNEYQVLNIGTESSPSQCGVLDTGFNINDIAAVTETDGDVYAYLVTEDSNGEFKIIMGGPGGSYATSGIFESATFNPGYSTANNRFQATFIEPFGTDIQFQVSMANLVSGSCPTNGYTFVGPSGTSSDWFNQASGESVAFPFTSVGSYSNPGQCIRYKVSFSTSSGSNTSVLNDITINYSP